MASASTNPCEPHGGEKRETYRQPWYPVQERYGLVFAFMGPPNRKPILPKYEALEVLRPGESVRMVIAWDQAAT
jgi:phenylpropionate dioxygenase-like ring-hydroxylating dioxygenase large terminal subunit